MAPFSFSALFSVFENGLHVWSTSLHPHSRSFFWMVHIFLPNLTASECFNNVLKAAWRAVALQYMVGSLDGATVEWSWSERDNRFSDWKRLFSLCQTKQWIFFFFFYLPPTSTQNPHVLIHIFVYQSMSRHIANGWSIQLPYLYFNWKSPLQNLLRERLLVPVCAEKQIV